MAVKEFKAESKKLLDMMIHSIYSNKEIFLRELISNASDAIDKLYFKSLTDHSVTTKKEDYQILLELDKENRTLTLTDNGIGMTREELEENLGTIARSGSLDFKKDNKAEDIDIIGQFGVGFYSAFMVASRVTVISRAFGSDTAWQWESTGAEGYTITEADKEDVGTKIIMVIKENAENENYDEFLDEYNLVHIVKKYSDYVRYPIRMEREKTRAKERPADAGEDYKTEYETYTELETLNSMVPLWKRSKSDVTDEEYNQFYKDKFYDFTDPARVIVSRTEGTATYNALLFIPGHAPFNYYSRDYEKGLQLYASGVLIMDKCADLLPDHFSFVKGIVDSQDLSLNISREMLQKDGQLKLIRNSLEKKIKNELNAMKNNDREKYDEFFKSFGRQLKFGCYESYGANSDLLKDLLLFHSAKENKLISLQEYVDKMPEDQKYIYFASGESLEKVDQLPQTELLKDNGTEILYFTDQIDEILAQTLRVYQEKEFRSILDASFEGETAEKAEEAETAHKEVFDFVKETLGDQVTSVKASTRLKSHPVCLTAGEGLSFEMEKYFSAVQPDAMLHADRILELNVEHPVFAALETAVTADPEKAKRYATLLYDQALLIAGLPLEDPSSYTDLVCDLMV